MLVSLIPIIHFVHKFILISFLHNKYTLQNYYNFTFTFICNIHSLVFTSCPPCPHRCQWVGFSLRVIVGTTIAGSSPLLAPSLSSSGSVSRLCRSQKSAGMLSDLNILSSCLQNEKSSRTGYQGTISEMCYVLLYPKNLLIFTCLGQTTRKRYLLQIHMNENVKTPGLQWRPSSMSSRAGQLGQVCN